MKITDVKIHRAEREDSRIKAYARVLLDDGFLISDIRIIEGTKGLLVAMPSRKNRKGEFVDIAHPVNQEVRTMFEKAIFDEYERVLAEEPKNEEE